LQSSEVKVMYNFN